MIDTSLFEEAELTASNEVALPPERTGAPLTCYPLAIRMECLAPGAGSKGRSLSVRLRLLIPPPPAPSPGISRANPPP